MISNIGAAVAESSEHTSIISRDSSNSTIIRLDSSREATIPALISRAKGGIWSRELRAHLLTILVIKVAIFSRTRCPKMVQLPSDISILHQQVIHLSTTHHTSNKYIINQTLLRWVAAQCHLTHT